MVPNIVKDFLVFSVLSIFAMCETMQNPKSKSCKEEYLVLQQKYTIYLSVCSLQLLKQF